MAQITKSAVDMRLNVANWPEGLDSKDPNAVGFETAHGVAEEIWREFVAENAKNASNPDLTPQGVRTANAAWAERRMPDLTKRLEAVRADAEKITSTAMAKMTKVFTEPATQPQDIALMQEVRSWLRMMPETQRTVKLLEMAKAGDRVALRAVFTAPAYLTGVDEKQLEAIKDIVAEADHPELFSKLQNIRKAATFVERALEGVADFIIQETRPPAAPKLKVV